MGSSTSPTSGSNGLARARRRTRLWGILSGVVLVAVLSVPKLAFIDTIGHPTPFMLYFVAIVAAAYQGGIIAGLLTTVLSAVVSWAFFLVLPEGAQLVQVVPALVVFLLEGTTISCVAAAFFSERSRAEDAASTLRAARDQLEVVLQGIDEGLTLQDGSGRLIYANQLAATLSGYASAEELLALAPKDLVDRFELYDLAGRPFPFERLPGRLLLNGEAAQECRVRFRVRATGAERWVVLRANAVRDEAGKVQFVVNMFRDVTDAHRREEELALAQEWFQAALRSIGDAVITTDSSGRVNLLNPVAERLTGWSKEEALGQPLEVVFDIIDEDTRQQVASPVNRVLREGVIVGLSNHTLLVRRDGTRIAIDDSAAPIEDARGELQGAILVFRDVSLKRANQRREAFLVRATEQLNSSLDYRTTLATVARLAVPPIADWCAVDILEEGRVERLAVAHVDPAKIRLVEDIQRRYPTDPTAKSGVYNILRTGEPEHIEEIPLELLEAAARDEEHRRLIFALGLRSYIGVPLKRQGRTFGVISLAMAESNRLYDDDDFTLAKNLAERASIAVENARLFREAERARLEAIAASRTKDEFLAMLGHELRNPLAPIRTALDLINLRPGENHDRQHAIIDRQVRHLVRLVDDLLDVSRITRGRIELAYERVLLSEVVERALEMVWPAGMERSHAVHVSVDPELKLRCDPIRMAQVIANLLSNSVKYTQRGGNVWIEGERAAADRAVIRVRDDGMGIGREMLPRVFELFAQEPQALDRARGGLGLGLAIVRGLVTAHGGSVSVRSDGAGKGAEFMVEMPLQELEDSAPAVVDLPLAEDHPGRPLEILVVDDNADARDLLAELLTKLGHVVITARDGPDALNVAREKTPALALLDIGLPGMDGYELGARLKELDPGGALALVALTGYGQPYDQERSKSAGFVAHLVKPVSIATLTAVLGSVPRPRRA